METTSTKPTGPLQCRHIFTDGHRCGSPCLRNEPFCYYHHTTRIPISSAAARKAHRDSLVFPVLDDRAAIQVAVGDILSAIVGRKILPATAKLLLNGLQIAANNLPRIAREAAAANAPALCPDRVEEIVDDEALGLIAPEAALPLPKLVDPKFEEEFQRKLEERCEGYTLVADKDWQAHVSAKAASLPVPLPAGPVRRHQAQQDSEDLQGRIEEHKAWERSDGYDWDAPFTGVIAGCAGPSEAQPAACSSATDTSARDMPSRPKKPLKRHEGRPKPSLVRSACDDNSLQRLNVGSLPALGSLDHVELNSLTLLKALEAARADRGVVSENILAILTADEPKTLSIVKPLHCSLFHVFLGKTRLPCGSTWVHSRAVAEACLIPDRWLSLAPDESARPEL